MILSGFCITTHAYNIHTLQWLYAVELPPPVIPILYAMIQSAHFCVSSILFRCAITEGNLVIVVSHILCENIKDLSCVAKLVPQHIYNQCSSTMCKKSEVVVLHVLHKNEASNGDMLAIMKTQQTFHNSTVLTGGDQLTCERQRCAKTHVMDGNTQEDRLDLLEPVVEDWHALQSFLGVSVCVCM